MGRFYLSGVDVEHSNEGGHASMITVAICDDMQMYREQLVQIINGLMVDFITDIKVIPFESGEALLRFQEEHPNSFDAIFLDVYMDGINGIETAIEIRKIDQHIPLIFLTSSPEHALESYRVHALDYILKPYSRQKIWQVIEKIIQQKEQIKQHTLFIKSNQNMYTVNLRRVVYFESSLRTVVAHFNDGTELTFYKKLADLEMEIQTGLFIRTHRSYLVNMLYIQNVVNTDVIMTTQQQIPMSKKHVAEVKRAFSVYILDQI